MVLTNQFCKKEGFGDKLLRWINLREGEGKRTASMFAFYTTTSWGLIWLEACALDLFLSQYGAGTLPLIYLLSSGIRIGLGLLYSWMQRFLPLRWVIIIIAIVIALPLPAFWIGLGYPAGAEIAGFLVLKSTILLMQLWLEASHALNDLNASITANQLFNIREVKRTYPIISSGILVADVVGGFSLPLFLAFLPHDRGLPTVIMVSFAMMIVGAGILVYLSQSYRQSFPEVRRRREEAVAETSTRRLRGEMRHYALLLLIFFALSQVLILLVEFQFLSHLGEQAGATGTDFLHGQVAGFLGIFNGALGICELAMQWLFASRLIDRIGVFAAVMLLPGVTILLSSISMTGLVPVFFLVVVLRFLYELLHYTIFAGIGPFLFHAIPDQQRDRIQSRVRGIAEPVSTAVTGLALLGISSLSLQQADITGQRLVFGMMVLLAAGWLLAIALLRSKYVGLLVLSAGRGQLSASEVDLRAFKQAVIGTLEKPGAEADKRSCIELLYQIDPKTIGEVLAPLLSKLAPALQHKSLEVMLNYPNPVHLPTVRHLLAQKPAPEVTAIALRYLMLTEASPNLKQLEPSLHLSVHPMVRGTAASLILRHGDPMQKAIATKTLRLMLTSQNRQERVMGCRALGDAVYLQALRLYVPELLKDRSVQVRRAVLEAIGATRSEEYYPYLLRGIHLKSTREAAIKALVKLENDALPMLVKLVENIHQSDLVRCEAWGAIGEIGTTEAIEILIAHLTTSWGNSRRNLLKVLLKIPQERGIEMVLDKLGRRGIEALIDQEMMFIGQVYGALADLIPERLRAQEADMLRNALQDSPTDGIERLFLLMKFLYPISAIQVASFNLQSESRVNVAQGLEILDNTLDIVNKPAFLGLLDRTLLIDKLQILSQLVMYVPMRPHDRVKHLLDLRHFISDWTLTCCFHLARRERWTLTSDQILSSLRHPTGYVREAVLSYLRLASPQALARLLPDLQHDRNPIVVSEVKRLMNELGSARQDLIPYPDAHKTASSHEGSQSL
ncbi:HEAT repeat domain-containing protein [Myxacorys almedinensis]|uniref:HEAT repeat domain-containing protein n=1 Tax=Myxacorys almedinensis TaxID=2651157 RepID=UPI00192E87FE|nr:HEAT repeat domain-containing protein [Myxacorys almedinensis]